MIIGIIQGRLTSPIEGHQTTPANWVREFDICKSLGLNHVEWNIDFNKNRDNPILSDQNIKDYKNMISSVCFDTLVSKDAFNKNYFEYQTYHNTEKIINAGIHSVTFPLLESSRVRSDRDVAKIVELIKNYKHRFPSININLELDCEIEIIDAILSELDFCFLTYDTGNLTYSNVSHELYIDKFFNRINNVHLKDRSSSTGESFNNFMGDTPFLEIFKNLSSRQYDKLFTLQMARNDNISELELIKNYIAKFRRMYEK